MSRQYFIVELTDFPDADETRIEVEGGTNYAVGVLEGWRDQTGGLFLQFTR